MITKVLSAANYGLKAVDIEVEVNVAEKGFPGFGIILNKFFIYLYN